MDRALRRRRGAFYTPRALARRLVEKTVTPLGDGPFTVCDPACGDGVLLLEVARLLRARGASGEAVARRIFGFDADPVAVVAARARLETELGAVPDVRVADALALDVPDGRYDVVVGNPPWVSYSGRHAQPIEEPRRRFLAQRYETFAGWPSLHGPFVELSLRWSRARVGLLLPAQVAELDGYGALRVLLRARGQVAVEGLGEGAFEGVTQPACLLRVVVGAAMPGGRARLGGAGGDAALVARLAGRPRPPAEAFGDVGVHTGNCARRLLAPGGTPVREGRDVHAYRIDPPRRTLHAGLARGAGDYFRVAPLARYREVPILLRQTAARPVAALHAEPTYFRNSVLACRGIAGVPPEQVVAWLNSSILARYHAATVAESGQRAFPQLKVRHLRAMPMPDWSSPPRGLPALARAVAHERRLDLADDLDALVDRWFP